MVGRLVVAVLSAVLVTGCALDLRGRGGTTESADAASPSLGLGNRSDPDAGPVGGDAAGNDSAPEDAAPEASDLQDAPGADGGDAGNGDGGDGAENDLQPPGRP